MTPNNTTAQKQKVIEIFNALLRAGRIRRNQDFFKPIGVSAPLGSTILQPEHPAKFPKSKIENLFEYWGVNPDFYWYNRLPMFLNSPDGNENVTELNKTNFQIAENTSHLKPVTGMGTRKESRLRVIDRNVISVPIVEKRAQASYALHHADPEYLEDLPKIYVTRQSENGNYVSFEVPDDSMDDDRRHAICESDVVLAKEVDRDLWHDKLDFVNYLFVIVYEDISVIRQITHYNKETGDITCHPFNPFYEDFTVNLADVKQLLRVYKVVDKIIRI